MSNVYAVGDASYRRHITHDELCAALEGRRKDAADPTLSVGDIVFCNGFYAAVRDVRVHAPGGHPYSPVRNELTAVEIITANGTRWHRRAPGRGVSLDKPALAAVIERAKELHREDMARRAQRSLLRRITDRVRSELGYLYFRVWGE